MTVGAAPTANMDVATKQYADSLVARSQTTLSVASGITASRGGCTVRKHGPLVLIQGGLGNATSTVSTSTNLFSILPAEYRPSTNVTCYAVIDAIEGPVTIRTDGYIRQSQVSNATNITFHGFYVVL